jgi:galactose mutarotase-like enzyme
VTVPILLALVLARYVCVEEPAAGPGSPPVWVLRDEAAGIEAAVAESQGGELASLRIRIGGRWIEMLYKARDYVSQEGWRGKAPWLWPATGRNFDPEAPGGLGYRWRGRHYPMPLHGFVREMAWRRLEAGAGEEGAWVTAFVADSEETQKYYPFLFRLTAAYQLAAERLRMTLTVAASPKNRGSMFFSAGNHITFRVPFLEGSDPRRMLIETPSTVEYLKDAAGAPSGKSRPLSYAEPAPLAEISPLAAVSLGGYAGEPYLVLRDPQGLGIRISHSASTIPEPPVVLFNLWGDPAQGFFSPEPWVGLQNSFNLQKGLVRLRPGGLWSWQIEIRPLR